MFNNILKFTQDKTKYLYENSLFLSHIDKLIFLTIIAVYLSSTFAGSDFIGFIALITIFLTGIKLLTKSGEKVTCKGFELFILAYFMLVIVSLFGSTLFYLSLKGFFKTLTYVGFYASLVIYLKDHKKQIPLMLGLVGVCLSFESFVGFLQNFAHVDEISTWQDVSSLNPEEVMTRVYGTLKPYNPNLLGGYFVVGIPALFGMCALNLYEKRLKCALVWLVLSAAACGTLFATGCRGSYLALVGMLLVTFLISAKFLWKTYKKIYLSIIAGCSALVLFTLTFISSLRARVFSIFAMRNDSSNSFRFNVYHSSLDMFKDNWLLGIGIGNQNFREIYGLYMRTGFDALSAYNIFLETAVESGIFALIAFVGFLICLFVQGVKCILKSTDVKNIIFVSTAIVSVVGVCIHGMVDTVFFRPQIQFVFWLMIAISSVIVNEK
ncbi:O-antigen ligase family protein [bacterium]|nr:O-antigen ligase family protein [bacterium]